MKIFKTIIFTILTLGVLAVVGGGVAYVASPDAKAWIDTNIFHIEQTVEDETTDDEITGDETGDETTDEEGGAETPLPSTRPEDEPADALPQTTESEE